ncbi:CDP-diacylglycerol-inositol 3-phosphatidyltransferase, partial [Serendipita sp. 399]
CLLDAVDGHAARLLNQTSRFGAVLDMITDRCTTSGLLCYLASAYPSYALVFQALIALDFSSHYVHMYSTLLTGSKSHKAIESDVSRILSFYYNNPTTLFLFCAGNELCLFALYLMKWDTTPLGLSLLPPLGLLSSKVAPGLVDWVARLTFAQILVMVTFPVCLGKNIINIVQGWKASKILVGVDLAERMEMQKRKRGENVAEYARRGPDPSIERSNLPSTADGLVIPPPKPRLENPQFGPTRTLSSNMTEMEAKEMSDSILAMLDTFSDAPPFTIKRICELVLVPRDHYRTVGKYLRGLEKTLLVTSSPKTFDISSEDSETSVYTALGMDGVLKTVSTPIFTPITFLHDDARQRSRSPPDSPLRLHNSLAVNDPHGEEELKGLGLVDELDTPEPGHMASEPKPLTATTSSEPPTPKSDISTLPSLNDRFVKAEDRESEGKGEEDGQDIKEDAEVEQMVLSRDTR